MHHVSPDLLRLQFPGHDAGKRFNVGRDSLFHPMLIVGQRGERRVHQLVGRDPVIREVRGGGVLRDAEACEALKAIDAAPGRALNLLSSAAFNWDYQNACAGDRKTAIVGGDCGGGCLNVLEDDVKGQVEGRAVGEVDLKRGSADLELARRGDASLGPPWLGKCGIATEGECGKQKQQEPDPPGQNCGH